MRQSVCASNQRLDDTDAAGPGTIHGAENLTDPGMNRTVINRNAATFLPRMKNTVAYEPFKWNKENTMECTGRSSSTELLPAQHAALPSPLAHRCVRVMAVMS